MRNMTYSVTITADSGMLSATVTGEDPKAVSQAVRDWAIATYGGTQPAKMTVAEAPAAAERPPVEEEAPICAWSRYRQRARPRQQRKRPSARCTSNRWCCSQAGTARSGAVTRAMPTAVSATTVQRKPLREWKAVQGGVSKPAPRLGGNQATRTDGALRGSIRRW